jgi:predicted DNA repair protein MutK
MRAVALAFVGIAITLAVYGAVALIVKADDVGLALAKNGRTAGGRAAGRGLVKAMPTLLKALSVIGTAAMIWVGGGILLHGLGVLGWIGPEHAVEALGHAIGGESGFIAWSGSAAGYGVVGLAVGAALIPIVERYVAPAIRMVMGRKDAE